MADDRVLRQLRSLMAAGLLQEAVTLLKSAGLSKVRSARRLQAEGMEPAAAKRLVHESPVWAAVRRRDEEFLADLHRALEELQERGDLGG